MRGFYSKNIGLRRVLQGELSEAMGFGSRLAEERKRLGLKQAEFAALVGTDVPKQSLYENDRRELRADYLARLADAKVDIVYVLTGQRAEGDWMDEAASQLLSAFLCLPPDTRDALVGLVSNLRDHLSRGASRTVHAAASSYRTD